LTGAAEHDRHDPRVAAQHPQRLRRQLAAQLQAPGAGPVLQVFQPHDHAQVRAFAAPGGDLGVVEDVAADVGEGFGLPLAGVALVVGGARGGVRFDGGGDRSEHGRIVEPATDPAARTGGVTSEVQFIDPGGRPVVGLGPVLVERLDQRGTPGLQIGRGVLPRPRPTALQPRTTSQATAAAPPVSRAHGR